jgi:Holliday junction resolvase RusA-like endonuclease
MSIQFKHSFFIPGDPVAKGRPRFNFFQKRAYTPGKTAKYEGRLIERIQGEIFVAGQRDPYIGPVGVEFTFYMRRPKSHTKAQRMIDYHTTKPDLDNLEKAIMDAMNGLVYKDDSQVCKKTSEKKYGSEVEIGVRVEIRGL